jgi:hypothetical protein
MVRRIVAAHRGEISLASGRVGEALSPSCCPHWREHDANPVVEDGPPSRST